MKATGRTGPLLLAALTFALTLGVAVAQAGKVAEATFGGKGTTGGLFEGPRDVAVDDSTGQVYVADTGNNRVQRFDSDGDFELTFGRDVIEEGAPGDLGDVFEICTVATDCKAGSKGTLADLPGGELANPLSIAIDQATGAIYVTTERVINKFSLDDNGTPAEPVDDLPVFDRAWGWDVVQPGGVGEALGNERQRVAISPPAASGDFVLRFESDKTAPIPFDATGAEVQSALEALPSLAPGDVVVSGPAEGPWTLDFGGAYAGLDLAEVVSMPEWNTLEGFAQNNFDAGVAIETLENGAGFEVCTVASQCKSAANSGDDAGTVSPFDLAVDPLSGDVFNANAQYKRISQYDPSGAFVRAFGWGVDTGADQFEICTLASKCQAGVPASCSDPKKFCPEQMPQNGQFGREDSPGGIAIDSAGVLYASSGREESFQSGNTAHVFRFDTTAATPAGLLLPLTLTSTNPPDAWVVGGWPSTGILPAIADELEADPGSGNLYYFASGEGILEIDASTTPASPSVVDTHFQDGSGTGFGYLDGADKLYVSAPQLGDRVVIVSNAGSPPIGFTIDPPTGIGPRTATFSGSATPNGPAGIPTSYGFEYRVVGDATWKRVPLSPLNVGDGNAPVPVEQTPDDLEPCADHEVRIFAQKALGSGSGTSAVELFSTDCIPPDVETLTPQRLTDDEATLAGRLSANNLPTDYYFEYGPTVAYGTKVPVPDGSLDGPLAKVVVEDVEGLAPSATYHYRLLATNVEGTTNGADVAFTTKAAPGAFAARAFEMVTPPFKLLRTAVWPGMPPDLNPNVGIPSLSGESILWKVPYFPLTDDVGAPADGDRRMLRRHPQLGWVSETFNTLSLVSGSPVLVGQRVLAASADLETQPLTVEGGQTLPETGGLLSTEGNVANRFYTFRKGTGVEGYTPWLTNPEGQWAPLEGATTGLEDAQVDDAGTALVRWGHYRGVGEDPGTPGDDDPSDDETVSGPMAYLQRAADPGLLPSAPKHLVNACTGSGPTATLVPSLTASETIASRECPTKTTTKLTSALGAVVGGPGGDLFANPNATALSEGGARVFFVSPDPVIAPETCKPGATGTFTSCPPQLYVRQYDSEGNATVRWISRAQGVGTQKAAEMGEGTAFQGASRDGRYVYFKTSAPLLSTDPNGGVSITTGSASDDSWDLYRYELPASLDEDPANGTLTRISGGPSGTADPSTDSHFDHSNPLRFLSDDGKRAYFLTTSPLAGADETAPKGGSTIPGGTVGNGSVRNLYLFDEEGEGADRYRFVAQLPPASGGSFLQALNNCASKAQQSGFHLSTAQGRLDIGESNCFRGTPDGSHVIFFTGAQLTADDNDEAGDVYLYDAEADELVRVTAPRAGAVPYMCSGLLFQKAAEEGFCNGDLGWTTVGVVAGGGAMPGLEDARGWGGGRHYNVAEGKDGEVSVFFESRSELVAADTNGDHWDVYEWRAGRLRLISPGDTAHHSYFSGNSLDGEDVFIWTSARIDPREIDPEDFDLYDARVGGGFPYVPPPTPCDALALECEGKALPAPPPHTRSTSVFAGPGNVRPRKAGKRRCRKGQVRRKGRCVKRRGSRTQSNHSTKGSPR